MPLGRSWAMLALLTFTLPAWADIKASVTVVSDYAYRGYSKSRANPVAQGSLDYAHSSGFFGGLTLSQVSFDDKRYGQRSDVELIPYLGWARGLATHWQADFSASRYVYAGKLFGRDADYNEFAASLHYRDLATARVAYAYDTYDRKATTFAYEALGRYSVFDSLVFSGGLGYNQAAQLLEYNNFFWNAGLTWYAGHHVSIDVRYVDSSVKNRRDTPVYGDFSLSALDRNYVFSLSVGF